MANICYVEARRGENWRETVAGFRVWIQDRHKVENYAWSEETPIQLADGRTLHALSIPPQHDIGLLAKWAQETGRLYAVAEGRQVRFPDAPTLSAIRP